MSNIHRNYRLEINVKGRRITIQPPLKISFSGTNSTARVANTLELKIFNLNEDHRNALVKDAESIIAEGQPSQPEFRVALLVGYGSSLALIYDGFATTAGSTREGANVVTSISCRAAFPDIKYSWTNQTVTAGETFNVILRDMPNTTLGPVSKETFPRLKRPKVIVGGSFDQLKQAYPDHNVSIVNGKLYILAPDEAVVTSIIPVVSADTGLLNTPTRQERRVSIEALLNPKIEPFSLFKLESKIQPHLNKVYRAEDINYSGDTWGSDWKMTITGYIFIRATDKEYQRGENA